MEDFDTNRYANTEVTQFLNSALVCNPTIPFTDYALGVQAAAIPTEWVYGQIGLFDAEGRGGRTGFDTAFHGPAHFLLINEYGLTPTFHRGKTAYPGTYRVGYWYDPTPKEFFLQPDDADRAGVRSGDWGTYLSFDQRIWKENDQEEDGQGLGTFFRYGFAPDDVNVISHFYSYGLSYTGLISSRNQDVLGAGFAHGSLSEALGHVEPGMERETAVECFYNIQIDKWVQLSHAGHRRRGRQRRIAERHRCRSAVGGVLLERHGIVRQPRQARRVAQGRVYTAIVLFLTNM